MPETRPALLFYCQHSLGIGHLTRSFALAAAMSQHLRVVFLNGGRLPPGLPVPEGIDLIDLPPLGMDDGHTVVSRDQGFDVQAARTRRRELIDAAVLQVRPAVLLVELFPFGRKKFAGEILPLIRAARHQARPAKVVCSLRDILVDARPDQQHHDDRARWITDRYFDAVLVHSDAGFARLESSFRPRRPMRTPVLHTGYVVPDRERAAAVVRGDHLLVSAGGGIVGAALFNAVLDARDRLAGPPSLKIIAGPFLPEAAWQQLQQRVQGLSGVTLLRHVDDMVAQMRQARASISQCGYNTALDLVVSGVPALVVPYETATENEQRGRAERLQELGALQCLARGDFSADGLARAIDSLLAFQPRPAALALDGARRSAQLLVGLATQPRSPAPAEAACPTA